MNLSTTYLGMQLPHPLIAGASPMAYDMDTVRRLEDAGVAAIVMPSLFEEQVLQEQLATYESVEGSAGGYAEALSYFPQHPDFHLGADRYMEKIAQIKSAVRVPVIASLNGTTEGGWLNYAGQMQQAGADAIELNVYMLAMDPDQSSDELEQQIINLVKATREKIAIPFAVKISPFFTTLVHFARRVEQAGANGMVIFNRLYQPDIDLEELEVTRVNLSSPAELLLRLRWLAILSCRVEMSLAVTGGVHSAEDAIKACMTGADAVQMVSALLARGPEYVCTVREEMVQWLEEHEYESLDQLHGSMNLENCPNPSAYSRLNYMRLLQSWSE